MMDNNLFYVHWFQDNTGKTRSLFEDDELTSAPERILITHEFLERAKPEYCARDGNLIMIRGKTTMVCYELVEESPQKLSWYAKLIKKEGL